MESSVYQKKKKKVKHIIIYILYYCLPYIYILYYFFSNPSYFVDCMILLGITCIVGPCEHFAVFSGPPFMLQTYNILALSMFTYLDFSFRGVIVCTFLLTLLTQNSTS